MTHNVIGNTKSLTATQLKQAERLFARHIASTELVPYAIAKEMLDIATSLRRMVGIIVSREGKIVEVVLGTRTIVYLPDLGRYRITDSRLRKLRLIVTIFPKEGTDSLLTQDLITDLEKLRFDAVVGIAWVKGRVAAEIATLSPLVGTDGGVAGITAQRELIPDFHYYESDFSERMTGLEVELTSAPISERQSRPRAIIVHVSQKTRGEIEASTSELKELARSAGVDVVDVVFQARQPDPKTMLGRGKLEEVVLNCLRFGIGLVIFDCELKPTQWRNIVNLTELKVLDRSMVILDVFAQRAQSNEGRLQVELAQLKYNLPLLSDRDSGLSRLTGGIGGRGPGETKLELERRRSRDRITALEKRIEQLGVQRGVREARRKDADIPLVGLVGYTNAGKSTLFNRLTGAAVFAEDVMFATLDPTKRRVFLPPACREDMFDRGQEVVLSDTVGFIRDLPDELKNAFRATLEDLRHANVLVHVVDCAQEGVLQRMESVRAILAEMEVPESLPIIVAYNKCDLIEEDERRDIEASYPGGVMVSAVSGTGVDALRRKIRECLVDNGPVAGRSG
jgi:GTP-binding protein HflX